MLRQTKNVSKIIMQITYRNLELYEQKVMKVFSANNTDRQFGGLSWDGLYLIMV